MAADPQSRELATRSSPPYAAAAIKHPYTFIILIAAIGAAFVTNAWWPLAIGAVLEAVWIAAARRSPSFRRKVDETHGAEARKVSTARQQEKLRGVGEEDRRRFLELDRLRLEIHKLCATNPNVTLEMVQGELDKLDRLIESYLTIAAAVARYDAYVASSDLNALEEEARRQEALVEKTADPEAKDLARRNLDLLQKRLEKATEIRRQLKGARGQLNLIENTIRLLRDQVVTMESPHEISAQLDELMTSVSAIESSGRETEALLGAGERRAQAVRQ